MHAILRKLGWALANSEALDDGALLTAFIERKDAAAFETLVQRHGPMVLGVCRRILGHAQDAEDAFQAVFLVLARRANVVRPRDLVANWLHGVAYRTALHARAASARRRSHEMTLNHVPDLPAFEREHWHDLQAVLDEELARLPSHYRAAVVLCELEGRSRTDAARHLGIPEGTLSSRLAAARKILAKRLTHRGLALPATTLTSILVPNITSAAVPGHLVSPLVQAALAATVSEAAAAGIVSISAANLAQGVMKSMFLSKLKITTAWVVGVGLSIGGAGFVADQAFADGARPNAEKPGAKVAADGVAKPAGVGDGQKPKGAGDGQKPKGVGDGQKPKGAGDGERPAVNTGGKGEAVTVTGSISKESVKRKRDDGSELAIDMFFLTESNGNKVVLPAPRVSEGGKTLDTFSLANFVGKTVTLNGRGYTTKVGEGSDAGTRVVRVIMISDVTEAK